MLVSASKSEVDAGKRFQVQVQDRTALDKLRRELHCASSVTDTSGNALTAAHFVALDTGCDVHTLIVDSSGQLNVTNKVYINSCNGVQVGVKPDAFDIFGRLRAATSRASIQVVGGWETDGGNTPNSHTVTVNGIQCPLAKGNNPVTISQPTAARSPGSP